MFADHDGEDVEKLPRLDPRDPEDATSPLPVLRGRREQAVALPATAERPMRARDRAGAGQAGHPFPGGRNAVPPAAAGDRRVEGGPCRIHPLITSFAAVPPRSGSGPGTETQARPHRLHELTYLRDRTCIGGAGLLGLPGAMAGEVIKPSHRPSGMLTRNHLGAGLPRRRRFPLAPAAVPNCCTGTKKAASDLQKRPLTWVEMRGFEPLTPSMRTKCATGLRYIP